MALYDRAAVLIDRAPCPEIAAFLPAGGVRIGPDLHAEAHAVAKPSATPVTPGDTAWGCHGL